MIVVNNQEFLAKWLCDRIGLTPTPEIMCLGTVIGDRLVGVVGYDGYNGASIQMHVAGEGNWFTKESLRTAFDYPFNVLNVNMVIGLVPSGNTDAIKFNTHLGFQTDAVLKGAHPDGALLVMSMTREQCRYLNRKRKCHGQEVVAEAA